MQRTVLFLGVALATAFAAGTAQARETAQQQRARQSAEIPTCARSLG